MLKSELLLKLQDIADDVDINETIQGIDGLAKSSELDLTKLTVDDYKNILENNATVKGYNQSSLDSAISKAIASHDEKFNKEKLPKILEQELAKRSNEGKSPEQLKLEELQKQIEQMQSEKTRVELSNKYSKILSEKGLPLDLVDYIISADGNEEKINGNIDKFTNMFSTITDTKVKEKLNNSSYVPPKSDVVNNIMTKEKFLGLGFSEQNKFAIENAEQYKEIMK
jgi:hypothetical protein